MGHNAPLLTKVAEKVKGALEVRCTSLIYCRLCFEKEEGKREGNEKEANNALEEVVMRAMRARLVNCRSDSSRRKPTLLTARNMGAHLAIGLTSH